VFHEDSDFFRFNARNTTTIGDAGLRVALTDTTRLLVQATRYDQELPGNRLRGVPTDNAGNFLTDRRWNANEPTDFLNLESGAVQARLESAPSDKLSFDATLRRFTVDEAQQYHEVRTLLDTNADGRVDTVTREFRDQSRENRGTAANANIVLRLGAHTLLGGVDLSGESSYLSSAIRAPLGTTGGLVPNLSLLAPVYGRTSAANYNLAALRPTITSTSSTRTGLYLQEQLDIGERFTLIAGARRDRYADRNKVSGQQAKDSDWTFRGGAIFKPREDVSLYASYSQSFEPQSVANQSPAAGGPFPPVSGDQYEIGAKSRLLGGRLQASGAVYQITRQNLLQVDPTRPPVAGVNQLGLLGEVRSRGFEVDIAADLTPDWVLTVNYGYNDAKVTATSPTSTLTNAVGDRLANAPKHDLGVWTRYQIPALRTAVALGGEHVSRRVSLDNQVVKAYTIFDASLIHDIGPVRLLLRVDNIFDKTYAASGFTARNGHFPGEPRTVFLEARARF
jgi:iron complex outermembrane receptor protein